ncbi:NAD-dependent epimerase/dehydratase family protein [Polyangium aurulentum]|uniref:NAD-dependent epimerase/dehydratase family protein n=1 Tax=Polyangium aurulentum TaxID=2567896 RepID=UPI0010AE3A60|nr:NAD-dependent epimerase/dehydratase family protein [Polyangium aurulentum]UQA54550.1 NAD-dependent epimerase/dehydratase family protein [Polyangium aurulentum]
MKVAVTGGSGLLGTLVLRALARDRAIKSIVSLDMRPPLVASAKLQIVQADVRDPDLARHFEGCDAVVHLAFVVTRHVDRALFEAVNVGGSENVFRAAAQAGVKQIVHASSIAAYGVVPGHPVPITEDTPRHFQAEFPYAATKYAVEAILDGFEPAHPDIAITRLRPSIILGRGMEHALGRSLAKGFMLDMGGPPMALVWGEDVADAVLLALKNKAKGAFNLSADEPRPASELAREAGLRALRVPRRLALSAAELGVWLERMGVGEADDPSWVRLPSATMVISSERAKRVLGWKPRCATARDVLRRHVEAVPGRVDRRIATFMRLVDMGGRKPPDPSRLRGISARVHLCLEGKGGGDFTIVVDNEQVRVERGAPRPPRSVVLLKAQTFLDLMAGREDPASAQIVGKVRIEGDPFAGFVLSGMIHGFRQQQHGPGSRAKIARALKMWFARGGSATAPR